MEWRAFGPYLLCGLWRSLNDVGYVGTVRETLAWSNQHVSHSSDFLKVVIYRRMKKESIIAVGKGDTRILDYSSCNTPKP